MANTIEWGTILQQKLDEQLVQGATSGWMETNAGLVRYDGGKTVKIPRLTLQGLGDYGGGTGGYPEGDIDLSYEAFTMKMDRAREFNFDRHDVDETNYVLNASQVFAQFQRTHVIPEIDAYRYSTIAQAAISAGNITEYTPAAATILSRLSSDIIAVQDRTGAEDLVITMNRLAYGMLVNTSELSHILYTGEFTHGEVSRAVKFLDGSPVIPVLSAHMKTAYDFLDGRGAGETAGGFTPAAGAKTVHWIICPKNAPLAISKQDQVKIFSPDENQEKDSWKTQYRKYHDCWITENALPGFQVCVSA